MKIRNLKIKKDRGGLLAYVLIIFFVLSILAAAIFTIFNSNLLQARSQESHMEAYYLAYSGAYMGFAAITQDSNELLKDIVDNGSVYTENDLEFGEGEVDIEAKKLPSDHSTHPDWIEVVATGTLSDDGTSVTRTLYIDPENQKNIKWK